MPRDSRSRKRRGCWLLALCFPLAIQAAIPDDFAYRYALTIDGSSAAWRVELSPAIYAVSPPAHGLRDVIVVNAQGRQVPFGPLPPTAPRAQAFMLKTVLLPLPSNDPGHNDSVRIQRNGDGAIVIEQPSTSAITARPGQWLLDAGRPVNLARIEITAAALAGDARFHLSVQASNDLQHWNTRSDENEIVSVQRGTEAFAQRSITLDIGTPARYYRLSLRDGDHAPWDSTQTPSVELHGNTVDTNASEAARQWLDAPTPVASTATDGTDYDYTLPASLPLEAARITLAGSNTLASYRLLDHDGPGDQLLAAGTAVQIGTDADANAPITFAPVRIQHLRLHTDTPLAQPPTLHVAWRPDVFVFLAEGGGPYSLLAGSHAARRGDYPLQAALDRIRPTDAGPAWQLPQAALGPPVVAAGPAALLAPKPPFDWTRLLLWLVLTGGALAVAAMAWSLLRQSRRDDEKH